MYLCLLITVPCTSKYSCRMANIGVNPWIALRILFSFDDSVWLQIQYSQQYWSLLEVFNSELNCFCGMVDRRKTFSLISSRDHSQRSLPSRISDTPRAGFEPAQNLSSGLYSSDDNHYTTAPSDSVIDLLRMIDLLRFISNDLNDLKHYYCLKKSHTSNKLWLKFYLASK